jgi:hypothetical protein
VVARLLARTRIRLAQLHPELLDFPLRLAKSDDPTQKPCPNRCLPQPLLDTLDRYN